MPMTNEVGAELIKFIKSHPIDADIEAKDVMFIFFSQVHESRLWNILFQAFRSIRCSKSSENCI